MEENVNGQPIVDKSKAFSAIDVGTTKIVALVGCSRENGTLEILGKGEVDSVGLKVGQVANVAYASASIREAVKFARETAGFFPEDVVVGVAGRHIRTTKHCVPRNRVNPDAPITQEELDDIMEDAYNVGYGADEQIIQVIPLNYCLNNIETVENPINMTCNHIDANFHIVLGKIQCLNQLKQSVELAGLKLERFYLEPLASAAAVLNDKQKEEGVALIDIGGGTTDIAIFKDNVLCTTFVNPIAGNVITQDIKMGCNISEAEAEMLKVNYGEAIKDFADENVVYQFVDACQNTKEISQKTLAGIIQSRVEDIIDAALMKIGTSVFGTNLGAGVVVTGGGSNLKNLPQLLTYKVRSTVKVSNPIEKVYYPQDVTLFNNAKYSTSVGLLMYAEELFNEKQQKLAASVVEEQQPVVEEPVQAESVETKVAEPHKPEGKKKQTPWIDRLTKTMTDIFDIH